MFKLYAMYIIASLIFIFLLLIFFGIICIEKEKIFLLSSIGIIVSAFMASFTLSVSINENKRMKKEELLSSKYKEYYYMRHLLIKIKIQNENLLEDIEKENLIKKTKSFRLMILDNNKYIEKIDCKEFFSYLPKNEAGKLMCIIARLSTISNIIELYKDESNLFVMMNKIKKELINHDTECSLLPFLEDLIKYLGTEIDNTKI